MPRRSLIGRLLEQKVPSKPADARSRPVMDSRAEDTAVELRDA